MFCIKCGHEIPEGSSFCEICGAKVEPVNHDVSSDMPQQETISDPQNENTNTFADEVQQANPTYTEEYVPQQNEETKPAKKKNKKFKIAAIIVAAVVAIGGIGALAYNAQPFISRIFKGEDGHFTQVLENAGESVTKLGSSYEDVQAKITSNIEYDFNSLASLASMMGGEMPDEIKDLKLNLTEIAEIDGKNSAVRYTVNAGINGVNTPNILFAATKNDMGFFVDGLTKQYISLGFLLDQYRFHAADEVISADTVDVEELNAKLEALTPILNEYRDVIIETIFNGEDNVKYETSNKDLGFSAYYYKVSIDAKDIVDVLEAVIKHAENDDKLVDAITDLVAAIDAEEAKSIKKEIKDAISSAADEFDASVKKELRSEINEVLNKIEFELWFDGRNNPLAYALTIDTRAGGKISFELRAYTRSGETVGLVQVKAAGATVFKISLKSEESKGRTKGDFAVQVMGEKIVSCDFDVETFEVHGVTLYDGSISIKLNTELFDIGISNFKIDATMKKTKNGMNTSITPSVSMDSYGGASGTLDFGTIKIETTVEALDEDIANIDFVQIDPYNGNVEDYIDMDAFQKLMTEWAEKLADVLGEDFINGLLYGDYYDGYDDGWYDDYDDDWWSDDYGDSYGF